MAQSHTESSYRGLDVFWNGPTQQPPVSWEDWAQRFQLIVNAKKKIDIEDLLAENTLPPNDYKTLEEPQGTEKAQVRAAREAHNERALQACQTEETRRSEQEKRLFKVALAERQINDSSQSYSYPSLSCGSWLQR